MTHKHGHNFRTITIPGGTTEYDDQPNIVISGGGDFSLELTLTYRTGNILKR